MNELEILIANSNLETIEEEAFYDSGIEEISFPASLKELKEGWARGASNLRKIVVLPMNNNYIFKEDKYLLDKPNNDSDEYDILVFASCDIDKIVMISE